MAGAAVITPPPGVAPRLLPSAPRLPVVPLVAQVPVVPLALRVPVDPPESHVPARFPAGLVAAAPGLLLVAAAALARRSRAAGDREAPHPGRPAGRTQ